MHREESEGREAKGTENGREEGSGREPHCRLVLLYGKYMKPVQSPVAKNFFLDAYILVFSHNTPEINTHDTEGRRKKPCHHYRTGVCQRLENAENNSS